MEEVYYSLRIKTNEDQNKLVSEILRMPLDDFSRGWIWEVKQKEKYFDFINEFLDVLKGHYDELEEIGVKRSDITIWMVYGYEQQCNLEFPPNILGKLSENGISLCISCYGIGNG